MIFLNYFQQTNEVYRTTDFYIEDIPVLICQNIQAFEPGCQLFV